MSDLLVLVKLLERRAEEVLFPKSLIEVPKMDLSKIGRQDN